MRRTSNYGGLLLLVILVGLVGMQAVSATLVREDVAVWYDFKDGSGNFVTDEAGNASYKAYIKSGAGGTGWNMTDATRPSGLGGAYYISNATNQSIEIPDLAWNDTFTIVEVKKQTSTAVGDMAFFGHGVSTGERVDYWWGSGAGTSGRGYVVATATADTSVGTGTPPEQWPGSWRMEAMRGNSTKGLTLAEGNNATVNNKATTSFSSVPNPSGNISIGKLNSAPVPQFNGNIAQFIIFRRYVTDAELTTLYNSGNYTTYDALFPPVVVTTFTVNVKDYLNASVVQGANVTLYNSSGVIYSNLSDASGNIVYSTNGTAPASLSFNVSKSGFFNLSGQTVTANVTANASLWQGRYLVSVTDPFDDSAVASATVTFYDGSTATTNASGVAGFAGVYNGTKAFTANKTGYFNASGSAVMNATTNVNLTVAEWTNLTVWSIITNSLLAAPFNVTVQGGKTYAYPFTNIYLRSGQMNFTWAKAGWYDLTFARNITALTNTTGNATGAYNNLFNVTAKNVTGSPITNATVMNISLSSPAYTTNCTTTNGSCFFALLQGYNYSISVRPAGYEYKDDTLIANATTGSLNTTHYTTNSISFRFVDEETYSLVNTTTVYYELISTVHSANYTTTTGEAYVDLLTPATYNIRYVASGYAYRFYTLTLEDNYHYQLNLTLLNATQATNVTITVKDNLGNIVVGAVVKLLKYDVATNSYVLNQVISTNFEGQVVASVMLNQEYYEFIVEYEGAEVYVTAPTYIYSSTFTLYIPLSTGGFEEYFTSQQLSGSLTHSNVTKLITYTWNDANNVASQACLYAYNYPEMTLYNSSCVASPSGSTTMYLANTSDATYLVKGYVTVAGEDYIVSSTTVTYNASASTGANGAFLGLILVVVFIFIGFWSLTLAVILGSIAPFLYTITGLWTVPAAFTLPLMVGGLVVAYMIGGRRQ